MTGFDYAVFGVIGLSMLFGVFRGFIREVVSLAGWIAATLLASAFAQDVAGLFPVSLGSLPLRVLVAFVILFVAVLLLASLGAWALSKLIKAAGLGLADRVLGAIFGFARGVLIVLVAVLLAGLTRVPREPFWRQAALSPPLMAAAIAAKPMLPKDLAQRVKYD